MAVMAAPTSGIVVIAWRWIVMVAAVLVARTGLPVIVRVVALDLASAFLDAATRGLLQDVHRYRAPVVAALLVQMTQRCAIGFDLLPLRWLRLWLLGPLASAKGFALGLAQ